MIQKGAYGRWTNVGGNPADPCPTAAIRLVPSAVSMENFSRVNATPIFAIIAITDRLVWRMLA